MSNEYSNDKKINFNMGGNMNVEVYNYDKNGNKIDPLKIILKEKIIYELVKKYIKFEN